MRIAPNDVRSIRARRVGRVLIVDDSTATRNIIAQLLESVGISDVVFAGDTASAYKLIRTNEVNAVLADAAMHPPTGLQLLQAVRNTRACSDMAFVVMTASLNHRYLAQAKKLGASSFLLKPFSASSLVRALAPVIAPRPRRKSVDVAPSAAVRNSLTRIRSHNPAGADSGSRE